MFYYDTNNKVYFKDGFCVVPPNVSTAAFVSTMDKSDQM